MLCVSCVFSQLSYSHQQAPDGWLRRIDQPGLKSDEQNINPEQIYWFKTWFPTSTNAGNESLASSLVMDKQNACNPKVTQSSDTDIHSWYKQVIADLFIYFFLQVIFSLMESTRYQMLFPHRKHPASFKGKIYGQPLAPDSQEYSPFFHLWHPPEEGALKVDEEQHSRFSLCRLFLRWSVNLIGLTGKIRKEINAKCKSLRLRFSTRLKTAVCTNQCHKRGKRFSFPPL